MVELRVVEPVEEVEAAGAGRGQAHAEPACALRVAGGHERRGFFVMDQDEADPVPMTSQALHDPVDPVAREPEHGVDAVVDQPLHQQFRGDLHPAPLPSDPIPSIAAAITCAR